VPDVSGGRAGGEAGLAAGVVPLGGVKSTGDKIAGVTRARRIRITVAYDGTDFHGWQVQPGTATIQGTLEEILGGIEGKRVHVAGSGRTDAGVHALAQVAAFTLENPIPADNLCRALNRLLPPAIRVLDAAETHESFHPRFDSIAKTYRYTIYRAEICSPFAWRYTLHHPYPLNETGMAQAARLFEGEHDFSAFAAADGRDEDGRSKVRTIFSSVLVHEGDNLIYIVRGSGFLKHMVRNLMGTLIEAGRGNIDCSVFPARSGSTALAKGLTLMSVEYPDVNLKP
jgi:tRNA pseudouridine38-40 synthase